MNALRSSSGKTARVAVAACAMGALLAGCASDGQGGITNQQIGTAVGALGGAILGSTIGGGTGNTVATIAGGVLGAVVGSEIGRRLDDEDKRRAELAAQTALETAPSGETVSWKNPDTGASGAVQPRPAFTAETGQVCREFEQTISTADGGIDRQTAIACRNDVDGTWAVVSS